jgi:predicted acylesterase/phospholipase RssA
MFDPDFWVMLGVLALVIAPCMMWQMRTAGPAPRLSGPRSALVILLLTIGIFVWLGSAVTSSAGNASLLLRATVLSGALFLVLLPRETIAATPFVAALAVPALWLQIAGSYHIVRDLLSLAGGLAIIVWERASRPTPATVTRRCVPIVVTLMFWSSSSVLDGRFVGNHLNGATIPSHRAGPRVGLALSGGGYRAALMHAGVLEGLGNLGIVPQVLSTVSGGSIIGAYYAAGGHPEDFLSRVIAHRVSIWREVSKFPELLRLLLTSRTRTDTEAGVLDAMFLDNLTMSQLAQRHGPHLLLCATDFFTGDAIGISADGVTRHPLRSERSFGAPVNAARFAVFTKWGQLSLREPETRVSRLVAASGAFPGAFASIPLDLMDASAIGRNVYPVKLVDGGVGDNSGLELLLDAATGASSFPDWKIDMIIASDGSAIMQQGESVNDWAITRAIDIAYNGSGFGASEVRTAGVPIVLLGARQEVLRRDATAKTSPVELWTLLSNPRDTVLDVAALRTEIEAELRNQCGVGTGDALTNNGCLDGELAAARMAFLNTSTLEDDIDRATAKRLFDLGLYSVAFEIPCLAAVYGSPSADRGSYATACTGRVR